MNRQLEAASSYQGTSMTNHTFCIWHPWFQRVHKRYTNTAWQGACHIPEQGCGRRSHTNGYCTSPEMTLFRFVVSPAISSQREPPEPQRSRKESVPGWIWHWAQAICGVASRTSGPPQHCVVLGGCQSNSSIGGYKTKLYLFSMELIPGISYTRYIPNNCDQQPCFFPQSPTDQILSGQFSNV